MLNVHKSFAPRQFNWPATPSTHLLNITQAIDFFGIGLRCEQEHGPHLVVTL